MTRWRLDIALSSGVACIVIGAVEMVRGQATWGALSLGYGLGVIAALTLLFAGPDAPGRLP